MTLNTQAMNHTHEPAPASDRSRRTLTRVVVLLLSGWAGGVSYAADVDFPSQPLQTGVVQPAPNVIFILDDSLSMIGAGGEVLDTGLTWCPAATCPNSPNLDGDDDDDDGDANDLRAPYTKNPLSYDPHTNYRAWATANTTDTSVERLDDAQYTSASNNDELATGDPVNLSSSHQTYYVPKPDATNLADQRQYYRYQIRSGGNDVVRAEWDSTAPSLSNGPSWPGETAAATSGTTRRWTAGGGTNATCTSNTTRTYTVPADGSVTQVVITFTRTSANGDPDLYANYGSAACTNNGDGTRTAGTSSETVTINSPTPGQTLYIGVRNNVTNALTGDLSVSYSTWNETALGCTTGSGSRWRRCTKVNGGDASTEVRALAAEKQNYANWYQYHRTRMKTAKAGGSEAFATLDKNFRVGLMGLYPSGNRQQVIGGDDGLAAPTATDAGNLSDIIPVENNGGLFVGDNRQDWFEHLHEMEGQYSTPLRQALNGAGKYFSTERAYQSTVDSKTTYLACRQNFAILTTDGYWNTFGSGGGEDPDTRYTGANISGDEEEGLTITGPNNPSFKYEPEAPYWYNLTGDYNDKTTLADIAMHYWKTDLRTSDVSGHVGSAANRVPSSDANPAFWQHMVTFGVGLGVRGELTDDQVAAAMGGTGFWPAPEHETGTAENPENVDDLRHAAFNSRGTYVDANDSEEFAEGITDALTRIGERRGSASNVLANSTSISTDSFVYQATYTAGAWRGDLLAYPISGAGLGEVKWHAGELIAAYGLRNIFTVDGSDGSTFPNSTQSTTLGTEATALGVDGTELANYLKGDFSKEKRNGGVLRDRKRKAVIAKDPDIPTLLGDIVDSSPYYVADNRTVFVGANDGMLHAFDASITDVNEDKTSGGGTEQFAYIPRGVAMDELAELADPLYATSDIKPHRFFVDGPIVVSARTRTPGKNYLVGALGRGGRGVYGLDVTNPGSFSADDVLWDKTGSTDAPDNMGNVISEPLISKLNSGDTAAVVANGPNSETGTASLFIIDLVTGATIKEFDTGTSNNALSAPRAVDTDSNGTVDYFFAGDLQGNLWRFDVQATSVAGWTEPPSKVFTAGTGQPISSAPGVAKDPATGNIWVFFGTGRYMTSADQTSVTTQTYYGIIVGTDGADGVGLTRDDLEERTISVVDAATGRRAFEPSDPSTDTVDTGWYIDLNKPAGKGERVISAPLIYDNILIFSSIVPPSTTTLNSCAAGGTGYINALVAFTGRNLDLPFFADLDVTTVGGLAIGSLPIDVGMPTAPIIIGDQLVVGDSSGGTPTSVEVSAPGGSSKRRVSWRELLNDQ